MTIDTPYRKELLKWTADAINKRGKRVTYPFQHWRDREALGKNTEKRSPPVLVRDCMPGLYSAMFRCASLAAQNKAGDKTQVPLQTVYDEFKSSERECMGLGAKLIVDCFDTGNPYIKAEESKKREAQRKHKRDEKGDDDDADDDDDDAKGDAAAGRAEALPEKEPEEAPGYIPSSQYNGCNPAANIRFCIRDNQLVKYDHSTRRILNATDMVNLSALNSSRHLREELVSWICKIVATKESLKWPDVTFVLHFRKDQPPSWWKNGKRLQLTTAATTTPAGAKSKFTVQHFLEADHSCGTLIAALLKAGYDVTVWTNDGDFMLICYMIMFHYRFAPARVQEIYKQYCRAPSQVLAKSYQRPLADDVDNNGLAATPRKAKFGKEPQLTLVLQGQRQGTVLLNMNVFCTILCNMFIAPMILCVLALLTKNDYIKKPDISNGVGTTTLIKEMKERINPNDVYVASEKVKRTTRAFWAFACPRLQKSLDARIEDEDAARRVDMVISDYAQIKGINPVTPKVGQVFALALYRWWRCSVLNEDEYLPVPVPVPAPAPEPPARAAPASVPAAAAATEHPKRSAQMSDDPSSEEYVDLDVLREAEQMTDNL